MKNILLFILFLVSANSVKTQVAIMPAHTHAAIKVIQKDLYQNRSLPSQHVIDYYPVYKYNDQYMIAALGKINSTFDKEQAIQDGFEVGAIIGSIISCRIPLHLFKEGFSYPGIEYIEVAEKIVPELDKAIEDIRADLVHKGIDLPQPYTGKNVLIGVVDWGFDYTHPMFYDTTLSYSRIMAAWDQVKTIGTPPPGFSHGAYYSDPTQLEAAHSDTFSIIHDYHGTHVAGIAGGSGAGTKYRGVGFESEFLYSQMRTDLSSSVDAFQWMYNVSQATGKRLVINNSWGGYRTSPLDGTSLVSQAIDGFSDLGVVFVVSGANNGNINFHLKKTFNQDSVKTRIGGFDYVNDQELWGQTISMWGEQGNPFSVKLRILSDTNSIAGESNLIYTDTSPAFIDTFLIIGTDTVFYNFITDAAHPLNGRPQMTLNVQSKNQSLKKILYAEAESGTVHFWNTRLTIYGGGNWGNSFTAPIAGHVNGDKNYGIGHPGVTTSVITAAAHQTGFHLTSFSSYGPRMDDFMKPDISAPGQDIISSFNSYAVENVNPTAQVTFHGRTYEFIPLSGTSMSAPMVTGVVSLILEANPTLTAAEVKDIVLSSARNDGLTGNIGPEGNNRWGHGKLDALNAIIQSITGGTAVGNIINSQNYLYPNPANSIVYFTGELTGNETYRLNRMDGTAIANGHFDGTLYVGDFSEGVYILSIENALGIECFKVIVTR